MARPGKEFRDRRDAGRQLASVLAKRDLQDPLVLALPCGGVPVAFEIASALRAPLDLLMVRKIGAPGNPEYGIGAVVDGSAPQLVRNEEVIENVRPTEYFLETEVQRQLQEIERRRAIYLQGRTPAPASGRTVIVVDDGIATGGTVRVAIKALRKAGAARIVVAVPVAPADVLEMVRREADDVVCLSTPEPFQAVGLHFKRFDQTSDHEVIQLLKQAHASASDAA